jgi:nitroreductase
MVNKDQHGALDAIYRRRSIRRYVEDREVEREKIVELLRAGMAAPSACNIQPWEFVVVTDKPGVAAIKKAIPDNGGYNAPAVIVVCGSADFIPWQGDHGEADCCAAIENMLIAATALGLGSVWIGGFDRGAIAGLLGIPDNVRPIGIAYFGYPAEHKEPATKYLEEAVHWQRYQTDRKRAPRPGSLVRPKA